MPSLVTVLWSTVPSLVTVLWSTVPSLVTLQWSTVPSLVTLLLSTVPLPCCVTFFLLNKIVSPKQLLLHWLKQVFVWFAIRLDKGRIFSECNQLICIFCAKNHLWKKKIKNKIKKGFLKFSYSFSISFNESIKLMNCFHLLIKSFVDNFIIIPPIILLSTLVFLQPGNASLI